MATDEKPKGNITPEPVVLAGGLGSGHVGRRVRVRTVSGAMVEDVLVSVTHERDRVVVVFENAVPSSSFDRGFVAAESSRVVVL